MKENRNIILAVAVVVLMGSFLVYWKKQSTVKDVPKNKEITTEKNNTVVEKKKDVETTNTNNVTEIENKTIYYYGAECPHCKDVMEYLDKNDIYSKVDFIKKEVWHNKDNSKELEIAATKCKLDPSNIGVPFVFDKGTCYMGGPDVIDFFAKKSGLTK